MIFLMNSQTLHSSGSTECLQYQTKRNRTTY